MKFISAAEVREKLTMDKAIEAVKEAFRDLSSGEAQVPDRLPLHTSGTEYLFMPAHFPSGGITTVKSVSINSDNPSKGLPFIHAQILVFDHYSGVPLVVVDGSEVTAIRTAAASGLATDLLANPQAHVAAIFGTGVQAKSHLAAIMEVRALEKVYIYGTSTTKSASFCEEMSPLFDCQLVPAEDRSALKEAEVVCTVTTAPNPVFEAHHISPGTHINAVGVYKPDLREIPEETVITSQVYVDQVEGALAEAGDLLIPLNKGLITKEHFSREIGQVVLENKQIPWDRQKVTLFKSVGNAIQDAAAVKVLLK